MATRQYQYSFWKIGRFLIANNFKCGCHSRPSAHRGTNRWEGIICQRTGLSFSPEIIIGPEVAKGCGLRSRPRLGYDCQAASVPAAQSRRWTVTGRGGRESKVTVTLSTRLCFPSPTSWTLSPAYGVYWLNLSTEDNWMLSQAFTGRSSSRGNDVTLHGLHRPASFLCTLYLDSFHTDTIGTTIT